MHNFKKIFLALVLFILSFVIIATIVMLPLELGYSGYNDSKTRRELAGSLDTLFCGASFTINGFLPAEYDNIMCTSSYNLSGFRISFAGRYELLKKEIERNDIKTVYLEIAYDTFTRDPETEFARGEAMTICRLDSIKEKTEYLFKNVSLFDSGTDHVLCASLGYGVSGWISLLGGEGFDFNSNRGHWPSVSNDVSLKGERQIRDAYASSHVATHWYDEYIKRFEKILALCQENNVKLVIVVTPLSDAFLWEQSNMPRFYEQLKQFCQEYDLRFMDFNLFKQRFELFSDETSFNNETHLSSVGGKAFTTAFAGVCKKAETESISEDFYSSYEDMMKDSPYWQYMGN